MGFVCLVFFGVCFLCFVFFFNPTIVRKYLLPLTGFHDANQEMQLDSPDIMGKRMGESCP